MEIFQSAACACDWVVSVRLSALRQGNPDAVPLAGKDSSVLGGTGHPGLAGKTGCINPGSRAVLTTLHPGRTTVQGGGGQQQRDAQTVKLGLSPPG